MSDRYEDIRDSLTFARTVFKVSIGSYTLRLSKTDQVATAELKADLEGDPRWGGGENDD